MKNPPPLIDSDSVIIQQIKTSAYSIPTDSPESDGTIKWDSTTLVLVEINAANKTGTGYTYADASAAYLIEHTLKKHVLGKDVMQIESITQFLISSVRNSGTCGISTMGIAAIDNALWDLKAKILEIPLCTLLGKARDEILLYGSGGFTSYTGNQTQKQFEKWAQQGITYFKMKIGREPEKDVLRVKNARKVIGDNARLFVDANGAYTVKQALEKAKEFSDYNVTWFEEPVSSNNLDGLCFIRKHSPAAFNIAAGEYGYNLPYFMAMLQSKSVDVLQADATRCGGITFFLKVGHLCESQQLPFSSHCAPAQHLHAALALPSFYIAEYFYDHERIESLLFEGVSNPVHGYLKPDLTKAGIGIEFKHKDAAKYKL